MAREVVYGHEQLWKVVCFNSRPVLRLSRFENIAGLECCGGIAVCQFVCNGVTENLVDRSVLPLRNIPRAFALESPAFAGSLFNSDDQIADVRRLDLVDMLAPEGREHVRLQAPQNICCGFDCLTPDAHHSCHLRATALNERSPQASFSLHLLLYAFSFGSILIGFALRHRVVAVP